MDITSPGADDKLPVTDSDDSDLMTPGEVAQLFRVDPKTVTRWAQNGRLTSVRTLGGHRRYSRREVNALLWGSKEGRKTELR